MQRLQTAKTLYNVNDTTNKDGKITHYLVLNIQTQGVKKRVLHAPAQPSQDVLRGDAAEEEREIARLVSSTTLPHQNSQPGGRGQQMARSKVLSGRARNT